MKQKGKKTKIDKKLASKKAFKRKFYFDAENYITVTIFDDLENSMRYCKYNEKLLVSKFGLQNAAKLELQLLKKLKSFMSVISLEDAA